MPDAPPEPEHRQLAAIMFTDMVDYSALAQRDQALALELLEEHRQIARSLFPRFNGTENQNYRRCISGRIPQCPRSRAVRHRDSTYTRQT